LVEDSAAVGEAVKQLLELLGASVSGPAATTAAAESLLAQRLPDVALLDFHLRGGERSDGLIAQLHQQGVPVILLSGSFEFPTPSSLAGTTILEKPVSEAQLLVASSPPGSDWYRGRTPRVARSGLAQSPSRAIATCDDYSSSGQ
jgi:CheY-like chemotaxis protein